MNIGKTIEGIHARRILDSRGEWTVEVKALIRNGETISASVPQGKSKGSFEAHVVDPESAITHIQQNIWPALQEFDCSDQRGIDARLVELDGTPQKSKLGANALLAVSMLSARAAACTENIPLWKYLARCAGCTPGAPRLYVNMINGGLHAGSGLAIQEYLVIPKALGMQDAVADAARFYSRLREYLVKNYGVSASLVGDEGGFAPILTDDMIPFEIFSAVQESATMDFGIDAAASNIKKTAEELTKFYEEAIRRYHLTYIEDPFGEEEFKNFAALKKMFGDAVLIAGDDLTVTNVKRMEQARAEESVNAIIIKPNQIGTLSEAIDAVKRAKEWGWRVIVSHRSGETNDDFIADFACGVGADGLKLGAPARGERVAKFNRLLAIEREMER